MPWIGYRYLTGAGTADALHSTFRQGVTFVNERIDLEAFLTLRKSGKIRFLPWLRSVVGAGAKAYWRWDDPGPFLAFAWNLASSYLRRRLLRLFSREIATAGIDGRQV